ncbi:MAG: Phosphatidate cytidylyltransferase [Porticoccaceae bacterium UBA1117]|nr:MAG: Phosphatidate cytidylyltransferase [Porticoccaceae bacterium UBA1117]
MLKLRIITAVCMASLFVAMLFLLPSLWFAIAVLPLVMMGGWEWSKLIKIRSTGARVIYLSALMFIIFGICVWLGLPDNFLAQQAQNILIGTVALWAIIFLWIQGYPSSSILWSPRPILALLGLILLSVTWLSVVTILLGDHGRWGLLLGILIIVFADVGGFVAGKLFGKHKLAPLVSPGKTWEGFVGVMGFQVLLIIFLVEYLPMEVSLLKTAFLIFSVALYSIIGDLFESMVKRHSGVKDSGSLLPGHGGVLDRIDGVMAALPLYALLLGAWVS